MSRLATITLYIDPAEWEKEMGEKLTDLEVLKIGKTINDEVAAGWIGYSSWHTGWVEIQEGGFVRREFLEAHDIEGGEEVVNS
jgi:hypothetical protein